MRVILHGVVNEDVAIRVQLLGPLLRGGVAVALRPTCVLLPIWPLSLAGRFGCDQLQLAAGAGEESVLFLLRKLLVLAARAAQVGGEGSSLVDDHDALRGAGRGASAVLVPLLRFLLFVLNAAALVNTASRVDGRDPDLLLAGKPSLRLEEGPDEQGVIVREIPVAHLSAVVHTVEPLNRVHHVAALIQIHRGRARIATFKLLDGLIQISIIG